MEKQGNGRFSATVIRNVFLAFLCAAVLAGIWPGVQAEAASVKSKARKAYQKMLTQKSITWGDGKTLISAGDCRFGLVYIDNNSVPELVLIAGKGADHVGGFYAVYTYRNGRVMSVAQIRDGFGYYKKKGIFTSYTALHGEYETYFRLVKGKATAKLRKETYYDTLYYDGVSDKQITQKVFNRKLKKLVGSTKLTIPRFYKNTKANRKKYIK